MKGICKPKSIGVYVASDGGVTISVGRAYTTIRTRINSR